MMIIPIILLIVFILFALYSLMYVSSRCSRWEEEREISILYNNES